MINEFNTISGEYIKTRNLFLFEALKSEKCYLGFARKEPSWGNVSLIKVTNVGGEWPSGVMYQDTDIANGTESIKFYDKNSTYEGLDIDVKRRIFIGRKIKDGAVPTNISELDFEIGNIFGTSGEILLNNVNDEWMSVVGLNPTYVFELVNQQGIDYDYFIINYSQANVTNMFRIDRILSNNIPALVTQVQLKTSYGDSAFPTDAPFQTLQGSAIILERTLNIDGEMIITGTTETFNDILEPIHGANFFLTKYNPGGQDDGAVLLDKITWYETLVDDIGQTSHIFTYEINENDSISYGYFRLTASMNEFNKLGIFNESIPFYTIIAPITDNNPPALKFTYTNHTKVSRSLLDVLGLVKIESADVKFIHLLADVNEKTFYEDLDLVHLTFEDLTVGADVDTGEAVVLSFVKTTDLNFAHDNLFESIMIEKSLGADEPTSATYRQIFVSYKPKDSTGTECSSTLYSEDLTHTIFNTDTYSFDLGQLLYVANKSPINRSSIVGDETFKIII